MNLFNGRLAKTLTAWCCEKGQRLGCEICPQCAQDCFDWREVRKAEHITSSHEKPNAPITSSHSGTEPGRIIASSNNESNGPKTGSYDAGDAEIYGLHHDAAEAAHPIFTPAQLEKLAQANALDELLGITRGNKEANKHITGSHEE